MKHVTIFVAVLCLVLLPAALWAQLTIVSSIPEHESVSVDTSTTLSITFSEALRVDESTGDIDIEIDITPEPKTSFESISEDKKTYSIFVNLAGNTIYKISLWEAVSESGEELDDSVFITFSTGATLPTASISGVIANPNVLSDLPLIIALVDESGQVNGLTPVNDDATFSVDYVADGSYYVIATTINEDDSNGGSGNYISYYGWDGTGADTPDEVEISSASVTGISLTMRNASIMKLLSMSPADDAVNVDRDVNLSFTFNLPLDTEIDDIYELYNFYEETLQINIAPDPGGDEPATPVFSNFGRTVTLSPPEQLLENTYYTGALTGAQDMLGKELDDEQKTFENPTQFGFTTGSAVPANSISGTITVVNEPASPVVVGLFEADPIDDDDAEMLAIGIPSSTDGSYSIKVPDGTYYPLAITSYTLGDDTEDWFSGYGRGTEGTDPITVRGADVDDIDIALTVPVTVSVHGMVRDTDGNPVAGAWVQIRSSHIPLLLFQTDSTGQFQFSNIVSEDIRLSVSPSTTSIEFRLKNIYFTAGNQPITINITVQSEDPHYSYTSDTGESYPIVIDSISAMGYGLSYGDEIAVIAKLSNYSFGRGEIVLHGAGRDSISRKGEIVVGSAIYNYELPLTITAWKDDPETEEQDGYVDGDSIIFEIWRETYDREFRAVATITTGDGKYGTGDSSVIANLAIPRYQSGERVRNILTTDRDKLKLSFMDNSAVSLQFRSGDVAGEEVSMESYSRMLPDSVKTSRMVQDTLTRVATYYDIASTITEEFRVEISFEYTEAMLLNAGLSEDDLIAAYYDSAEAIWKAVPTLIDPIRRIALVITDHFSLWALTDSTDNLITEVEGEPVATLPLEFRLYNNYPNPFNPTTTIKYELKSPTFVTLAIYNILGQRVRTLVNTAQPPGTHQVLWDARSDAGTPVSSGVYFFRIQAGAFIQTNKMLLLR